MTWFVWALLNPILFNTSNYIEKFLIDQKVRSPVTLTILGGGIYFLVGICILFYQKNIFIPFSQLTVLLVAGILLQFYLLPLYKALAIDEASRITPLFQLIPVFSSFMAFIFLGERLSLIQLIGFLSILIGGFIISIERFERGIFSLRKSLWYMMLVTFLYALVVILFQFIVIKQNFWVSFGYKAIGAGVGSFLLFLYPPFRKQFLSEYKVLLKTISLLLLLNQACIVIGEFAESLALSLAPAALVTIIQDGTQPFFALATGIILSLFFPRIIQEDISKQNLLVKLVAIGVITVGLVLIYH